MKHCSQVKHISLRKTDLHIDLTLHFKGYQKLRPCTDTYDSQSRNMFLNLATRLQRFISGYLAPQPVNETPEKQILLDFDIEENEYLYRIQRGSRIVYVFVLHTDIVPRQHRTDARFIVKHLRCVPKWNEQWTTLTVRRNADGVIESTPDEFPPHSANTRMIHDAKYLDITDCNRLIWISHRLTRVAIGEKICILKICPFAYETPYLLQEILAYASLSSHPFTSVPNVLGYVYEETKNRVTGFLIEEIQEHQKTKTWQTASGLSDRYIIMAYSTETSTGTTFWLPITVSSFLALIILLSRRL